MKLIALAVTALFGFGISQQAPAQVLDLTSWALAVPVAPVQEILEPELDSYSSEWFHPTPDLTGVLFTAPVDGAIQPGSDFPRTELRQRQTWDSSVGTHTMWVTEAVVAVPRSHPALICAQVHDSNLHYVVVVELDRNRLWVKADGKEIGVLDPNYQLGNLFNLQIVAAGGNITLFYNGNQVVVYPYRGSGLYFKQGAYLQSAAPIPGDTGTVLTTSLRVADGP